MFEYFLVFIALFMGVFAQGVSGFGSMLIAMPLLTMVFPLKFSAAMMSLLGFPVSFYIFYHNRAGIDWKEVVWIAAGSLAGIPIGLWTLGSVDPRLVMRCVGGLVVVYAAYALLLEPRLLRRKARHESNVLASLFGGLCAGVLGGAFNTSGPPLILYGDWLHWPRERFRAILQGVFLVQGILVLSGHVLAGNIESRMFFFFAVSIPAITLGLYIGHRVDRKIRPEHFRYIVLGMLVVLGLSLVVR